MSLSPNVINSKKDHDLYFYIEMEPNTSMVTAHVLSGVLCQFDRKSQKTAQQRCVDHMAPLVPSKTEIGVCSVSPVQKAEGVCECSCVALGLTCKCAELQLPAQELPHFD